MRSPEREEVPVVRKDVLVGRVDLVRALSAGGVELQEALADLLGFERESAVTQSLEIDMGPEQPPEPQPDAPSATPVRVQVPFWQVHDFEALKPLGGDETSPVEPAPPLIGPVHIPPASLASGAEILTRLRRYSAFSDASGGIDLDRTVASLSRGEFLRVFPRGPASAGAS